MSVKPAKAIEVFFSYSHKDEELRDELENHLSILKRQGVITGWHDRRIGAGKEWEGEIDTHLNTARVILLLISSDFLASDYCYDVEMKRAMERHEAGEARVIPVILRPVDWEGAPFDKLQALPTDAKPVSGWPDLDQAFENVAQGIRAVVEELASPPADPSSSIGTVPVDPNEALTPPPMQESPLAELGCIPKSAILLLAFLVISGILILVRSLGYNVVLAILFIILSIVLFLLSLLGLISDENLDRLDRIASILSFLLGIALLLWSSETSTSSEPHLYILSEGNLEDTYLIAGNEITKYDVGDDLIVYGEIIPDTEVPIALLRVIARNPDTLSAQAILVHPSFQIRPRFRVDDRIDRLRAGELVPSYDLAIGYFLREGRVRTRPDAVLEKGTVLQALKPELLGAATIDYLPFDPPIKMRVVEIGPQNAILDVELISGEWPGLGTIIMTDNNTTIPAQTPFTEFLFEGCNLLNDGEIDRAEKKFNEAQKLEPQSAEPWYWKAKVAIAKGNKLVALEYVKKALELAPNHYSSLVLQVELLLSTGESDKAKEIADQSYGISDALDPWLDCLNRENLFSSMYTTLAELERKCYPPIYKCEGIGEISHERK